MLEYSNMAHSRLRLAVFTAAAPWGERESFILTEIVEFRRRAQCVVVVPVRPSRSLFHGELAREISRIAIRLPLVSPAIVVAAVAGFLRSPRKVWKVLNEVMTESASWRVLLKNLLIFPKAVCVAGLLRKLEVNHIHAHWASVSATMAFVVARLCGVPWSFTAHRWDISENNLLSTKVRAASFVRAISQRGRGEVLHILGERDWPTLYTVHMGTTIPECAAHTSMGHCETFSIACIANLLEVKGHRYLIKACRLLRERGRRFECHIIGGGPLRKKLDALIDREGVRECVRLRGPMPHDQVMGMFRRGEVDLIVLPSVITTTGDQEGIPVVLMEALAHRIPAISTETGGIPELLGDGAGILIKPADSSALADAIERVIMDPVFRTRLSAAGFRRVSTEFNIETITDRLVSRIEASLVGTCAEALR